MEMTGARVNIPPLSLNKNEITVAGDKDCVAKATAQIMQLYKDIVSVSLCYWITVEVLAWT